MGVRVLDRVDATCLEQFEAVDVLIFNFPHGGTFVQGAPTVQEHRQLLLGVFKSAMGVLKDAGCLWMSLLHSQVPRRHTFDTDFSIFGRKHHSHSLNIEYVPL